MQGTRNNKHLIRPILTLMLQLTDFARELKTQVPHSRFASSRYHSMSSLIRPLFVIIALPLVISQPEYPQG